MMCLFGWQSELLQMEQELVLNFHQRKKKALKMEAGQKMFPFACVFYVCVSKGLTYPFRSSSPLFRIRLLFVTVYFAGQNCALFKEQVECARYEKHHIELLFNKICSRDHPCQHTCLSIPTASIPSCIMDTQPSLVANTNNVNKALARLSKLYSLFFHAPPLASHCCLVSTSLFPSQKQKVPLNNYKINDNKLKENKYTY